MGLFGKGGVFGPRVEKATPAQVEGKRKESAHERYAHMIGESVIDGDYINEIAQEFAGTFPRICRRLMSIGNFSYDPQTAGSWWKLLSQMSDEHFMQIVHEARKEKHIRTPFERLMDPSSSNHVLNRQHEADSFTKEQQEQPEKLARLDAIAHILNTSENAQEVKKAHNEAMVLMGREPLFA